MASINTKFSVGDEVYIIDSRGIGAEYIRVNLETIQGIEIGGAYSSSVRYKFRSATRTEHQIYTDLEEAKKAAKKEAKQRYEKNLEIIDEQRLKDASVAPQLNNIKEE